MKKREWFILWGFILIASGCMKLDPLPSSSYRIYQLNVPHSNVLCSHRLTQKVLAVGVPNARAGYGSKHILYMEDPQVIGVFPQGVWSTSFPSLFQSLAQEFLAQTGGFQNVVSFPFPLHVDNVLWIDGLYVHHVIYKNTVEMGFYAKNVDVSSHRVLSSKYFHTTEPVIGNDFKQVIEAMDRANQTLLLELCSFLCRE